MAWWSIRFGSESFVGSRGTRSGGRSLNHRSRADMIWSGGMVAREMLFEVQECFSTGSSASFAGTAEHVVDIPLDKVSKVLASEAPAVNAIVDLGKVVKGRSPFVSKFR